MLNRGVLIVRPRQTYLDWAADLDDSGILPEVSGEQTVYLIPEFENDGEPIFGGQQHDFGTEMVRLRALTMRRAHRYRIAEQEDLG